jgi:prephenate dehydratase
LPSARTLKVAFQGEPGAYSEEAARTFFRRVQTVPQRTLGEVFRAVQRTEVQFGIVPAENSLEGSINQTYDLLLASAVQIRGEVEHPIRHCLISHRSASLKQIRKVYSHPQALQQCARYIERHGWEPVSAYDTAGSVRIIRTLPADVGAIASRRAAALYGMKVLAEGIADSPRNFTRFFVLGLQDVGPSGADKTSLVFALRHEPGSLYRALGVLARRHINLTKIESRPTRTTPWEYNFFVDFEGHRTEPKVQHALQALAERTSTLKVLGSYPQFHRSRALR